MGEAGGDPDPTTIARIKIPQTFTDEVNSVLGPGATLIVTDQLMTPVSTGSHIEVVDADPPSKRPKSQH
jgi:hypothetical protein